MAQTAEAERIARRIGWDEQQRWWEAYAQENERAARLRAWLSFMVPVRILELRQKGGPTEEDRERAVIWLHYWGGYELSEGAKRWGGLKSRGSKLHRQALVRLRTMLEPTSASRTPTALECRSDGGR
jgi:hypothetical protein